MIDALKNQLQLEQIPDNFEQKIDLETLQGVVEKLETYFADGDAESTTYFSQYSELLNNAFPKVFKMLQTKIDNYDFPDALELLKEAAKEHGIIL